MKKLLYIIVISLFLIPFLWLKPGEMDLGGDSSRLYFYDPVNFLKSLCCYATIPTGLINNENNTFYQYIPFVSVLAILKYILGSSYLLITLFNSFQLIAAFLSIYAIAKEFFSIKSQKLQTFLPTELASIISAIFYVFSPQMIQSGWDKALHAHHEFFLNPIIFFLSLKFLKTNDSRYLLLILFISFIFSVNFSWSTTPQFFAFFPLAIIYLFIYSFFIRKWKLHFKKIFVFTILFLLIHSFHLLPVIVGLFDTTGVFYEKAFADIGRFDKGLNYFLGWAPNIQLFPHLLGFRDGVPSIFSYEILFFSFPLLIILGLILNKKFSHTERYQGLNFLLLTCMFLLTLYLITANITQIGFELYKLFFNIPGFLMFRSFDTKFLAVHVFYSSFVTGYAFFYIFLKKKLSGYLFFIYFMVLLVVSAFPFIRGDMINFIYNIDQPVELKVPIKMDPEYEKVLDYIREDPFGGRYLLFPFNESYTAPVVGTQNGIYLGPSIFTFIAGKADINGYHILFPFSETFLQLAKTKDYKTIANYLSLLNVRYVFYNNDELAYKYFPDYPYSHVRDFLPPDRDFYKMFLAQLPITEKKRFGQKYTLYEVNKNVFLPQFYVAKDVSYFNKEEYFVSIHGNPYTTKPFVMYPNYERRTVFLEDSKKLPEINTKETPQITFTKVSPTRYKIKINGATKPYLLVFSQEFRPNWKLFLEEKKENDINIIDSYFDGEIKEAQPINNWFEPEMLNTWVKNSIAEKNHFTVNGYANGWYISPSDVQGNSDYTLIVELTSQRYFLLSIIPTGMGIMCCIFLLYKTIFTKQTVKD